MSAEDRLLSEVTCTSPEGNIHTGKFRSSNDPQSKSQGVFKTIGGNFGRVQDLGAGLRTMNFIISFDDADCDITSEAFISSLREKGGWIIDHPVRGRLTDQFPALFDPINDPVQSSGIIAVATTWITDYPEDRQVSQIQRASEIQAAVVEVNEAGIKGFIDNIQTGTANLRNKIQEGTDLMQDAVDDSLGELINTVEGATDLMTAVGNGINNTLLTIELQTAELAAQCQFFCQLPAQLLNNTEGRLISFGNTIDGIISDPLGGTSDEKKNQAVTNQMTSLGVYGGLALSVISNSDIQTRIQAIEASELIRQKFEDLTNALDVYGEDFTDLLYFQRYFSQTDTFSLLADLAAKAQEYLLDLSVSLKKEKTVTLDRPLSATFASLEFYDNADDETVDLLIDTNCLTLEQIMVMAAGTKLVIYV